MNHPTPRDAVTTGALRPIDLWPVALVLLLFAYFFVAAVRRLWPFPALDLQQQSLLGGSFGILAALFSGLAFAGLIITILIQARELRLQRVQLTLQRGELEGQRAELARLASAQDAQNYALLVSAFAAAEAYEQRLTSASPSREFTEAIRYLRTHLSEETAKRQRAK